MIRRETKQREAILKVLRHTDSHPTADWIYDEVRKVIPNISKGTVYRNLKILREDREISELNLSGTPVIDIGALAGLKNLQVLWLDNTKVSDIRALSGLTDLRWLYLRGTSVEDQQVVELRKALTKPKIIR